MRRLNPERRDISGQNSLCLQQTIHDYVSLSPTFLSPYILSLSPYFLSPTFLCECLQG